MFKGCRGASELCRHERLIELAYEDHRFWDIRRWMIGATACQQMHTVNIKYLTASRPSNYRKANGTTWGPAIYSRVTNPSDYREWNNKAYFFPIRRMK
jgi:hypothetical protein